MQPCTLPQHQCITPQISKWLKHSEAEDCHAAMHITAASVHQQIITPQISKWLKHSDAEDCHGAMRITAASVHQQIIIPQIRS
jgi:hypothetical protein